MKLKDGSLSVGKKVMIDGQQRTTAMMTAIAGLEVIMDDFSKKRIKIAFNPLLLEDSEEERFKVQDNAVLRDKRWISDISEIFDTNFNLWDYSAKYAEENPGISGSQISAAIMKLLNIKNRNIGVITLKHFLTIDEVTEIFIRINSQGAKLNQADFAMSKIAANTTYGGNMLRKAIDYFSHLAVQPEWYSDMCRDAEFVDSEYFKSIFSITWLSYNFAVNYNTRANTRPQCYANNGFCTFSAAAQVFSPCRSS